MLRIRAIGSARYLCLAIGAVAGLVATGCNNSTNNNIPANCGAPSGQVALAYPAPNSSGIPDNITGIVFASTSGLSSSYQAVLQQSGASGAIGFQTVQSAPTPLPSPLATPIANAVYQLSANNGTVLSAASTYAVYLNDSNSTCTPTLLGSFTAQ